MTDQNLDTNAAKQLLNYDMFSGQFVWKQRPATTRANKIFNAKYAGKKAGVTCPRGYVYIRIRGYGFYLAHRLAWLITHGDWPTDEIDHIDLNPSNNSMANLRAASRSENASNRGVQSNSKSGVKGVYWRPDKKKWAAQVAFGRKVKKLGYFKTIDDATAAYAEASKAYQGEYARQ